MDDDLIALGTRAKAAARRAGTPWMDGSELRLDPGPHLFLDWRYVLPGEVGLVGPYWAEPDGTPMQLRLWKDPDRADKPFAARFVPRDTPHGIRIVREPARKSDPLPAGAAPGARIIHADGRYRTWYSTGENEATRPIHYAESTDGHEWHGDTECTFDFGAAPGVAGLERSEIFLDPSAPDAERFKMFFRGGIPGNERERREVAERFLRERPEAFFPLGSDLSHLSGMWGAVSPDGIAWTALPGPLVIHYSDTTNVVYYDQRLERYVWYARCNWFYGRRCIGRAETDDFRRWPGPEMLVWPTSDRRPSDDWYTNSKTIYPGTVDQHLMFPSLYHHHDDTSELLLYSSPDGIVWNEVPGGSVLDAGPEPWDAGCVFGGTDLIPLGGDEVALPYGGYTQPHKYPRNRHSFRRTNALAIWPRERLGGIQADDEGAFATLPLITGGSTLRLNARVRAAGHVLVELAGRDRQPLPGHSFADADPVLGDSLDHTIRWNGRGEIARDPNQPLTIRFRLRCATLFSFELH